MMNKPRGLVTTTADEKGRETVYSLLASDLPWVGPVGRLDKASEGLLLLTNDSEWAAQITDPATGLEKTYRVQINAIATRDLLNAIMQGQVVDGELLRAVRATLVRRGKKNSWLEITLDEGKNRHIRRLLESLEVKVERLIRIAIGSLRLGNLAKGAVRPLHPEEKEGIDAALKMISGSEEAAKRQG